MSERRRGAVRIKWLLVILVPATAGILLWNFPGPLLRAAGNFLICEDRLSGAEVLFVLGGNSYDRGRRAAQLYSEGYAPQIVCLGKNVPEVLKAAGVNMSESELTAQYLKKILPVDSGRVINRKEGTSTMEEAQSALEFCRDRKIRKAIILSSRFHTRRVSRVYKTLFGKNGIETIITGAPSSQYKEEEWWKSEEGLIFVNNEYVKLLYYRFKYSF